MKTSSEYSFRIFISSTVYNLKDLRAGLEEFLKEQGYCPILSSARGFPETTPDLQPWESCLPVLETTFVVALIIDGHYGKPLAWPHYQLLFQDRKVSPTHGEYLYGRATGKKIFVFIRSECMSYYESYRTALKNCDNDEAEAESVVRKTLPKHIEFETLKFIREIKTTDPIPWVTEFDDVTHVQQGIQKKLVNELAKIFMLKDQHTQTVIDSFKAVIDKMPKEEQVKVLGEIDATKEFAEEVKTVQALTNSLAEAEDQLKKSKDKSAVQQLGFEKQVEYYKREIKRLEDKSQQPNAVPFFIKDNQIRAGNPVIFPTQTIGYTGYASPLSVGYTGFPADPVDASGSYANRLTTMMPNAGSLNLFAKGSEDNTKSPYYTGISAIQFQQKCAQCGKVPPNLSLVFTVNNEFKTCPECKRFLCNDCWPTAGMQYHVLSNAERAFNSVCPDCKRKEK